ncbi:MAG: site-specific integrase [Solirubrobacterales bacterium]|nr:site-specific integrase [Solirubrobacterales bacterium]
MGLSLARNQASAEMVDRPTVRYSGEFDRFDADELAALARAAVDHQESTLYLAAAWTGLRQGELLGCGGPLTNSTCRRYPAAASANDVDLAGQRVRVRRAWSQAAKAEKAPKSGKVRSVPLVAELIPPLDRLSQREHFTGEDDLVFCTEVGEHLNGWTMRRKYHAALKRAGLRKLTMHSLRHCFGTVAVRAFPLSDVQAMLGHAHVTTTMRYVHHRPGADDAAKLSSAFRGNDVSPLVPALAAETAV